MRNRKKKRNTVSFRRTFVAVIPAFNEQASIQTIVKTVRACAHVAACIVVDDNSSDNTGRLARDAGAIVIRTPINSGTGEATHIGLKKSLFYSPTAVILLDADGQHDPAYIPKIVSALTDDTDIVIGSRYLLDTAPSTSYLRRLGTKIISFMMNLKYGQRIHDPTSGYRVFNIRAVRYFSSAYPYTFSEPEVVIEAIKRGMKIREISIEMKPRLYGNSTINLPKALKLMLYITRKILSDSSQ